MTAFDDVSPWTVRWWNLLPAEYRRLDAAQTGNAGGYPLLRWMDGIGRMGGEMRQVSDDLWFGKYADPMNTPEQALQWLAQMLGVPPKQRDLPTAELRNRLVDITSSGRKAVGTRGAISEAVKRFLIGARQAQVGPSTTTAHAIVVAVREDEVPGSDLAALATKILNAGVMPAGHTLIVQSYAPTWDQWEAGITTWNSKEATIETWTQSDSKGVALE